MKAGTASTVHPLSNDTGVAASTLRLTRLPADVQAQTDGSGGVQISADKSLKGETRSIGYLVCDASGNTCGGTTITVTFT